MPRFAMESTEKLESGSRGKILDWVQANPGMHLREIARTLALPLGTALYHLDYLDRREMLVTRRDGRYKRYFVRGTLGREEKTYVSAFHHNVPRRVAEELSRTPRLTQRELCALIGVSRSTLSFHVSALVRQEILRCEDGWPENRYSLSDPALVEKALGLVPARETKPVPPSLDALAWV